ncbi:MAG: 50S ribosomal protein L6 [Candidatus Micrarchaeota archaeon]|nr:50S ribosomal protein L6 [Candidatus Micrarchaeota archaeon]
MERKVEIPEGVDVRLEGKKIKVSGPLGTLERDFSTPLFPNLTIEKRDGEIIVSGGERRKEKAMVGTVAAHIKNMILGVTKGFEAKLKAVYVHFPITLNLKGNELHIENFLGEKKPRKAVIPDGVEVKISGQEIKITGTDKELVGMAAARIEQATRIRARDRRKFQDGVWITQKPKVVG